VDVVVVVGRGLDVLQGVHGANSTDADRRARPAEG
jgi:hypothetical protein